MKGTSYYKLKKKYWIGFGEPLFSPSQILMRSQLLYSWGLSSPPIQFILREILLCPVPLSTVIDSFSTLGCILAFTPRPVIKVLKIKFFFFLLGRENLTTFPTFGSIHSPFPLYHGDMWSFADKCSEHEGI